MPPDAQPDEAPLLRRADAALFAAEWALAALAGIVIFALMALISADVLARGLFAAPIRGQVDATSLAMVSFGVLCISYCYRRAAHIRMDILVTALEGRARWAVELATTVLALVVVTAIIPGSWTHFMRAYEFGDTTMGVGLPTWPSKLAVPVGLGVMWLRLTLELWIYGRLIADPGRAPVGVPAPPDPTRDMDS